MLEHSSSAKLLETGSHLVSQYFGLSTGIYGVIFKCHLPNTFCTQHSASDYRTLAVVVLARFTANVLDPHLSRIDLSWSHLTKECASNTHQASFHVL